MNRAANIRVFCLGFGLLEALGAALWCVAGAGIYGSPLAGMRSAELTQLWTFLVLGPFWAGAAALVALWQPRRAAYGLILGGAASAIPAASYLATDAQVLPLALVSLPMILLGLWLIRSSAANDLASQVSAAASGKILLRVLLFLTTMSATYVLFLVLAINNVTGLRVPRGAWDHENMDLADSIILLCMTAVAGVFSLHARRWHVPPEIVFGIWLAIGFSVVVILCR